MRILLKTCWRLLIVCVLGALVVVLRYILRTPQKLDSKLPGESRIYKWRHGHIFYNVAGKPDAPALVLLHAPGIGASAYEMCHLMELLRQEYRVYAPDLPGFGLSDHPVLDYSASTYISLCRDFLREVVGSPALLVASGLSSQYSVAVAAGSPELCQHLVLLSPVPLLECRQPSVWLACLAEMPLTGFVLYALMTARPILRKILERWDVVVNDEELDYRFAVAHQLGAQRAVLALLVGKLDTDVSTHLAALSLPLLTIWGGKCAQNQSSLVGSVALIPEAGLSVHKECPGQVADILCALPHGQVFPSHETAVQETLLPTALENTSPSVQAYCVKCRHKRTIQDARKVVTKNGRSALEGTCPVCTTRLFRFTAS